MIYGGKEQIHFAVNYLDFKKLVFSPEVYLVNIEIDGNKYQSILQDVQYHPVTDKVLHADFLEISDNKPIIVGLPIRFVGVSPGVLAGGQMIKKMYRIKVKGLVNDMPEFIEVDISKLVIGGSVKIRDMKVDKLTFLDPPNSVVVRVKMARAASLDLGEEEEEEEGEEGGGEEAPAAPEGGTQE